jgi:hypothetical protein
MSASAYSRQLEIETELWRRQARRDLCSWSIEAQSASGRKPAKHHRLLIGELEGVASGRTPRLMVFMPPGSAKSTYCSRLFPPWWFATHPNSSIIGASHTSTLAESISGHVQRLIRANSETLGYELATENRSLWETTNGCSYLAAVPALLALEPTSLWWTILFVRGRTRIPRVFATVFGSGGTPICCLDCGPTRGSC